MDSNGLRSIDALIKSWYIVEAAKLAYLQHHTMLAATTNRPLIASILPLFQMYLLYDHVGPKPAPNAVPIVSI